jgi:3-hydroxyacyl-CoA dehydrogenase/enoyl-CoA hydratase/3-hydroxybutyryl-CoA epimerase
MALVEVVVGKATGQAAIDEALALVAQIGKVAILAQDSPFFYTSRVFDTYIREGMEMLVDGIDPLLIDEVGRSTGMPRGPLELSDDVAIDLLDRIAGQRVKLLGDKADRRRSDDVIAETRFGRKNGQGFYDYPKGGEKQLWAGLAERWPVTQAGGEALVEEMRRRLIHRQAVEAARCIAEGVLTPAHADTGALLGWGFPKAIGGPVAHIEALGLPRFVAEADELAESHGPRFAIPDQLRAMAAEGRRYSDGGQSGNG